MNLALMMFAFTVASFFTEGVYQHKKHTTDPCLREKTLPYLDPANCLKEKRK